MGRPTVAISVAGSALNSNPIDLLIPHIFIQKPKTCSPCIDKKCKDQKCMLQISVDEVFDSIVDLL
jgi:ADP-heptose:LPS heptosyltransferase